MYETLRKYIDDYASAAITDEEFELVKKLFAPKKIRKKQYFLQEGEVCKYFGFIVKGSMRHYSVDDKGIEHIIHLAIENWWVGDRESYVMLTPSIYNIDAWEDTDLLVISRADQLNMLRELDFMRNMIRTMEERNAVAVQKRLNAAISLSAEKRYDDFAAQYPDFIERFPQHLIASYLGITKETLSRVRHQALRK